METESIRKEINLRYFERLAKVKARTKQLSKVVSEILRLQKEEQEATEMNDVFCRGMGCAGMGSEESLGKMYEKEREEIAQRNGFVNYELLYRVVQMRTNGRWAYMNMGHE